MADAIKNEEKWLDPEKLRMYRIKNGARKLKNRSSKDILRLNHCNKINIYRSFTNEALNTMANEGNFEAKIEIDRRKRKATKKNPAS